MKVKELLNFDREIEVTSNYDFGWSCKFGGRIILKPKGKKEFKTALNLEWWFNGSEEAIVHCETEEEHNDLVDLIECIAGDCSQQEWDMWFREPDYE